jgi:hypothetical protein
MSVVTIVVAWRRALHLDSFGIRIQAPQTQPKIDPRRCQWPLLSSTSYQHCHSSFQWSSVNALVTSGTVAVIMSCSCVVCAWSLWQVAEAGTHPRVQPILPFWTRGARKPTTTSSVTQLLMSCTAHNSKLLHPHWMWPTNQHKTFGRDCSQQIESINRIFSCNRRFPLCGTAGSVQRASFLRLCLFFCLFLAVVSARHRRSPLHLCDREGGARSEGLKSSILYTPFFVAITFSCLCLSSLYVSRKNETNDLLNGVLFMVHLQAILLLTLLRLTLLRCALLLHRHSFQLRRNV